MKYSSGSVFAILVSLSLLAGCATTGTTPANSAADATATTKAPASETKAPAKSSGTKSGGSEPECD